MKSYARNHIRIITTTVVIYVSLIFLFIQSNLFGSSIPVSTALTIIIHTHSVCGVSIHWWYWWGLICMVFSSQRPIKNSVISCNHIKTRVPLYSYVSSNGGVVFESPRPARDPCGCGHVTINDVINRTQSTKILNLLVVKN